MAESCSETSTCSSTTFWWTKELAKRVSPWRVRVTVTAASARLPTNCRTRPANELRIRRAHPRTPVRTLRNRHGTAG